MLCVLFKFLIKYFISLYYLQKPEKIIVSNVKQWFRWISN